MLDKGLNGALKNVHKVLSQALFPQTVYLSQRTLLTGTACDLDTTANATPMFVVQPHLCLPNHPRKPYMHHLQLAFQFTTGYKALFWPASVHHKIGGGFAGCSCCLGRAIWRRAASNHTGGSQHGWCCGCQMCSYQGDHLLSSLCFDHAIHAFHQSTQMHEKI